MTATIIQFPLKPWQVSGWYPDSSRLTEAEFKALWEQNYYGANRNTRTRQAQREYNMRVSKMVENAALGIKVWETE